MTYRHSSHRRFIGFIAACAAALLAAGGIAIAAEAVSEGQILRALTPKNLTRNLSGARTQQEIQRQNFINSVRGQSRSLTLDERSEVATIARERPSIDLEIYFEYNSAEIANKAVPDLMKLGRALTNPALQGGTFLLSGHTDGKGGAEYNQGLSERRAQAGKTVPMQNFRIAGENPVSAGHGQEQVKKHAKPFAPENRRGGGGGV